MDIQSWFKEADLEKSAKFIPEFERLLALFVTWNSKINLTAIRDQAGIWQNHFLDSLLATKYFPIEGKVLDLGTGGGFPCLPLAITQKFANFLALDSVGKKLKAVQDMADTLKLGNVQTLHARAEDAGQDDYFRERFDTVVSRAVAPWPTLLELALPFVKVGGRFIAYQGPAIKEDLELNKNLEQKLGGTIGKIYRESFFDQERVLIEVKKTKPTPKQYPRESGLPKKNPLKN